MTITPTGAAPRLTAGALRRLEAASVTPTTVEVTAYVQAMTAHCPFLGPSVERGLTRWTVYEITTTDADPVEAEVFHAGVEAAETIRERMREPGGALACECVVLLGSEVDHRTVTAWPYWALRNLYAPLGVLLGKFYAGDTETDSFGSVIPPAPFSFLPVRAAVKQRDPRFLGSTPEMARALAAADDDGRNVFATLACDWTEIKQWARTLT